MSSRNDRTIHQRSDRCSVAARSAHLRCSHRHQEFSFPVAGLPPSGYLLIIYRQIFGLGAATGLSDGYPWGIWKTFNVMTLTALGSGSFPIGIAAWIFHKRKLHAVMRITLLISFLVYLTGLLAIAVDVSRPWNVYNLVSVFRWNTRISHVGGAVVHAAVLPVPALPGEHAADPGAVVLLLPADSRTGDVAHSGRFARRIPYVVALAYTLPMLHQSALGGLMLLVGNQVYPLWQTPLLPLLYMWAAAFIGVATTIGAVMLCCLAWKRPLDQSILDELVQLMTVLILPWVAVRLIDIILRGKFLLMFNSGFRSFLFWDEIQLVLLPTLFLRKKKYRESHYHLFSCCVLHRAGRNGISLRSRRPLHIGPGA